MKTATQLLAGGSVVVADQVSKLATSSTGCGTHLCPVRNDALMLGIGHGPTTQVLLIGLAGLVGFCLWVRTMRRRIELAPLAVVVVVAGILGNLVDRVLFGSVRDFLLIPGDVAINVADVALTVGLLVCAAAAAHSITIPFRTKPPGGETT
jgi:lipoprotein signal peptidase